jgi:hypothetical protein
VQYSPERQGEHPMPIRYKFLKLADNGTEVEFERSWGVLGSIGSKLFRGVPDVKSYSESECKVLYEDACGGWEGVHTPTPDCKDQFRDAYHAIRANKQKLGISFNTEGLSCED